VKCQLDATLTSSAPDDVRMHPKHVELRIHQQITLLHQVGISHYFYFPLLLFGSGEWI